MKKLMITALLITITPLLAFSSLENFKYLICEGKTTISYIDDKTTDKHTLTCFGPVTLDHETNTLLLQSPINHQKEEQVCFTDRIGKVSADLMQAFYDQQGKQMVPEKILINGNVHILQTGRLNPKDTKPVSQYALADYVEFLPETQIMTLYANDDNRVLFFDEIDNFQMSAEKIVIKRNETTRKESIQGIGKVRFIFNEDELLKIQNSFLRENK